MCPGPVRPASPVKGGSQFPAGVLFLINFPLRLIVRVCLGDVVCLCLFCGQLAIGAIRTYMPQHPPCHPAPQESHIKFPRRAPGCEVKIDM